MVGAEKEELNATATKEEPPVAKEEPKERININRGICVAKDKKQQNMPGKS